MVLFPGTATSVQRYSERRSLYSDEFSVARRISTPRVGSALLIRENVRIPRKRGTVCRRKQETVSTAVLTYRCDRRMSHSSVPL
jgi:hypothetical protein